MRMREWYANLISTYYVLASRLPAVPKNIEQEEPVTKMSDGTEYEIQRNGEWRKV